MMNEMRVGQSQRLFLSLSLYDVTIKELQNFKQPQLMGDEQHLKHVTGNITVEEVFIMNDS